MTRDHSQVFEKIYQNERWGKGKGSGTGSSPDYCAEYLEFLRGLIPDGSRVMDIGCGDHQLYAGFDLTRWVYMGTDASDTALQLAFERYEDEPDFRKRPVLIRAYKTEDLLELMRRFDPQFILIKDVMMHWSDEEISEFLDSVCPITHATIITVNNHRYFRKPEMNGQPRQLDRYSWAPVPEDHPALVKHGFRGYRYYPRGKFKLISIRSPHG